MELLRQSPSSPKTALVAALDKTTQLFLDTAVQRGIKILSDTLLQACNRSCACGQSLSPPVIPLYKLTMFQRRKITLSSFLLPPLPSPGGQHNLPHPSILGKRSFIAGKGWREGEPLQLPFSFLPGQRLFNVLGLMEQAAQHCSEGQCLAPSAGNKASFIGTQKTQLKCQLTLILFGTDTCSWDLLKPRGILSLTRLQLLGTVHCALMGIVRAIPSMCHAMC